jgi:hypothetical protein
MFSEELLNKHPANSLRNNQETIVINIFIFYNFLCEDVCVHTQIKIIILRIYTFHFQTKRKGSENILALNWRLVRNTLVRITNYSTIRVLFS